MRRRCCAIAVIATAVAAGPFVESLVAQRGGTGAPVNAGRFVAIGCVSRAPSTLPAGRGAAAPAAAPDVFMLTDYRGDKPTVYRLEGDQKELTFHVGHTLEVAGPLTTSSGGAGTAATLTLKITSMTYVSKTCVQIK